MITTNWDKKYIELATLVAHWSKDPSTKCGAVIVRPDKTLASIGYNGFPKKCDDNEAFYNDRQEKYGRTIHAEVNAILHAHEPLSGCTIYTVQDPMIGPSCDNCTACVIQSGILEVVCPSIVSNDRWNESINRGLQMYNEAGIKVRILEEKNG